MMRNRKKQKQIRNRTTKSKIIRTIGGYENDKKLGILEVDTIKQVEMKKNLL